jgi:hypothetical protein
MDLKKLLWLVFGFCPRVNPYGLVWDFANLKIRAIYFFRIRKPSLRT